MATTKTLSQIRAESPAEALIGTEIVGLSQSDGGGGFNTVAALLSEIEAYVANKAKQKTLIWSGDAASVDLTALPDSAPDPGDGWYLVGYERLGPPTTIKYTQIFRQDGIDTAVTGESVNVAAGVIEQVAINASGAGVVSCAKLIINSSPSQSSYNIQSIYKLG